MNILNQNLFVAAAFSLPDKLKDNLSYAMLIIMAVSAVYCVIKCIQGADLLDRGEEGKKKIYSGIAIGVAPWVAVAGFQATGLWAKLGISMVPSGIVALPQQIVDIVLLATWVVIGIAFIWCLAKVYKGADELDKGEEGKTKIVSGLAIAAAPWVAVLALNISGFWDALGLPANLGL